MVANEVDDMVAKIRNKDFTDVTLVIVVILMEAEEEVADMLMDNVHWTWTGTDQDMGHLAHQKIGQFRNFVMSLQNPYFGQTYKKHL